MISGFTRWNRVEKKTEGKASSRAARDTLNTLPLRRLDRVEPGASGVKGTVTHLIGPRKGSFSVFPSCKSVKAVYV